MREIAKHIHTKTACCPDAITAEQIKYGGEKLYTCLYKLFSFSYVYGVIPDIFTRAIVSPYINLVKIQLSVHHTDLLVLQLEAL